jgi:hypothetical protein
VGRELYSVWACPGQRAPRAQGYISRSLACLHHCCAECSATHPSARLSVSAALTPVPRLTRALAETALPSDGPRLSAAVLPLLYTAADAAASADGPLAVAALDTLSAVLRVGGTAVAEAAAASTAPQLLWTVRLRSRVGKDGSSAPCKHAAY